MMRVLPVLMAAIALIGHGIGCVPGQRGDVAKGIVTNTPLNASNPNHFGRRDGLDVASQTSPTEDLKPNTSVAECRRIQVQINTIIETVKNRKETIKCSTNSDCLEWTVPGRCGEYFGVVSNEVKNQLQPLYSSWGSGSCYSKAAFPRPNCAFHAIRMATGEIFPICVDQQCIRTHIPPPSTPGLAPLNHQRRGTPRSNTRPETQLKCPHGSRRIGDGPPRGFEQGCKQPDGTQHGKWILWTPQGSKLAEQEYKDGKLNGPATSWHLNGVKEEEGEYHDGKRVGVWTSWYRNGQKKAEGQYKSGKKAGIWTCWDQRKFSYTCP